MVKLKSAKVFVAVFCIAIMLFAHIPSATVSAFNYPKISFGKAQKGELQDYFGGVSYEFHLTTLVQLIQI